MSSLSSLRTTLIADLLNINEEEYQKINANRVETILYSEQILAKINKNFIGIRASRIILYSKFYEMSRPIVL